MSTTGPVGVGLIGAGNISEQYLGNMIGYPDLAVRFIADLVPERAQAAAAKYSVPESGTVEQLLANDAVEIVINLTIPAAHAEVSSAVLAAGKHVWTEKPLTLDRAAGQALVDQADAAGLRLGCAPDTVLGPGLQTVRRLIDRGAIGTPLTATAAFLTPGPHAWHPNPDFLYQTGGGPLLDMSPYYLTALAQILGPIARVAASGGSAAPSRVIGSGPRAGEIIEVTVPTYVTASYQFESGGIAQGTFSFDSPLTRVGVLEITGSQATLVAPDPNYFTGDVTLIEPGNDEGERIPVATDAGRGIGVVDMARSIRAGVDHRATGRLGLHVLDAMLATLESIESRTFVEVASTLDPIPTLPDGWDPTERTL